MVIKGGFIASMEVEHELRIQKAFGNRVRELRKLRQLSQETLALACDLDRTYIGGVERGERNISLINIHKIADALGVDTRDMFDA
jgi:transcriptional regulator with XRE-family HTH domain